MELIPAIYEYLNTDEAQRIRQQFVVDEVARFGDRLHQAAQKFAEATGKEFGGLFKDASGEFYNEQARRAYEQLYGDRD